MKYIAVHSGDMTFGQVEQIIMSESCHISILVEIKYYSDFFFF